MLENECQPNIQESNESAKKRKTLKIYAVAAAIATVVAVVLRTVILFCFYDIEIGYHSEGFVTSFFEIFCVLSVLFFVSSIFAVKRDTPTADGNGRGLFVKLGSAAAFLSFAAYFSMSVFSTTLVASSAAFDLLSKITALMGIVYFAIGVFAPNTNKNIRGLLGFGVIIWCIYALAITYFDIYVQLNSPDKILLHLALISIMIFIVSELRCFVLQMKKGFYLFSACAATFFCSLSSIPSFLFGYSIGEMNKYYIYDIVIFAIGIYSLGRLVSFSFDKAVCVDQPSGEQPSEEQHSEEPVSEEQSSDTYEETEVTEDSSDSEKESDE